MMMGQENTKKALWCLLFFALMLCLAIGAGSPPALAAGEGMTDTEYETLLQSMGVTVDQGKAAMTTANTDGAYLGTVTISLEKFVLGEGYVIEPYSYPLYEGVNVADIVAYVTGYRPLNASNPGHRVQYTTHYAATGTTSENFLLTSVDEIDKTKVQNIPAYIKTAIQSQGGVLTERASANALKAGDIYANSQWTLWINNQKMDKSYSDYTSKKSKKTLKAGDVIRIQFSLFGDGRELGAGANKLLTPANKDQLTARVGEINSWYQAYLENGAFKAKYDAALAVLSNPESTQEEVDAAWASLKDEPGVDSMMVDERCDFLMGNIAGRIAVGQEFEITALDVPRANDDSRNFVRKDLLLEVVQGKNCVSIRQAPGTESGATSNANMKLGATYFAKGLKQGIATIKVSHPGYEGRETYVVLHITNNDNDLNNTALITSDLDYITKYDTIHYTDATQKYPITLSAASSATPRILVNDALYNASPETYTYYNEDGVLCKRHKINIPLQNGYNTVIITGTLSGQTTTKVYNIRASHVTYEITNETNPGESLKQGDTAKIKINGIVNPLPKISRLYNPSLGQVRYKTNLPRVTELRGSGSQYEITSSTITVELTGCGDFYLYDGALYVNAFGGSGWLETPKNQIPAYKGRDPIITGGGGGNTPQIANSYSILPEISFHAEETVVFR